MKYTRQPGDKAFRKVSLATCITPHFEPFTGNAQQVSYNNGIVLEIQREDDSLYLCEYEQQLEIPYKNGGTAFYINKEFSNCLARLWTRRADGTGIAYKLPTTWFEQETQLTCYVPGGTANMELFGDRYFDIAFRLRRV